VKNIIWLGFICPVFSFQGLYLYLDDYMIHTPGWSITSISFSWHPARNPVCLVQYYMIWLPELREQANLWWLYYRSSFST